VRPALKVAMQTDGNFVDVILLYPVTVASAVQYFSKLKLILKKPSTDDLFGVLFFVTTVINLKRNCENLKCDVIPGSVSKVSRKSLKSYLNTHAKAVFVFSVLCYVGIVLLF
jgi:hypothetical protein